MLGAMAAVAFAGRDRASAPVLERRLQPGLHPFTGPADVPAGSGTVCDREQLVAMLTGRRLTAWAGVLGLEPVAVDRYVRGLFPATLTSDTPVTDHAYVGGRASAFQTTLGRGTAVLVDAEHHLLVRCRSGSPLRPALGAVPGAVARVAIAAEPPGVTGPEEVRPVSDTGTVLDVAGTYALEDLTVTGPGCSPANSAHTFTVSQSGGQITIASDRGEVITDATVHPDGTFAATRTDQGGTLEVSGRFATGRLLDGRLTLLGCEARFTGTRS